jgi:MFS family permease
MVIAVTFVTLVVVFGPWYAYSVFLVALLREFGWSRSLVAGAFSAFVLVHGVLGPAVGWMGRRFGPKRLMLTGAGVMAVGLGLTAHTTVWWHLYVAFGGISAIGISMAGWIPSVMLVRGWFPDRVGTMVGLASTGIGVSILALVPLTQVLIDWCGWRWALRILAVLIAGWVLPAVYFLVEDPPPPKAPAQPIRSSGRAAAHWTVAAAVKAWRFWALAAGFFAGNFVTQMLLVHQIAYLVDHGVSVRTAAVVAGGVGLISILGKVSWGVLSDRAGRELAYSLAFGCVVASIALLALAGRHPASALPYLYAALFGLGYGAMAPVPPAATGDLFSGPAFSTIYGTLYTILSLGIASGAWMAGLIFDRTGSYAPALWVGLGMAILSPTLLWIAAPRRPNPPPVSR